MKRFVAGVRVAGLVAGLLASACACKNKPDTGPGGGGGGSGTGDAASCDGIKAHVEGLYRAEAEAGKTDSVDETVADNVAMVMTDCAASPETVAACAGKAGSVAELEERCLIPLDEEGSEGERFTGP